MADYETALEVDRDCALAHQQRSRIRCHCNDLDGASQDRQQAAPWLSAQPPPPTPEIPWVLITLNVINEAADGCLYS